jgi:hypothetical protein
VSIEAHRSITHPRLTRQAFGADHVRVNPGFLSAHAFVQEVWRPTHAAFGPRLDRVLLVLPARLQRAGISPEGLVARLGRFLEALPEPMPLAIELREAPYLTEAYRELLARHRVAPVLTFGPDLPPLAEQAERLGVTSPLVVRLADPVGPPYPHAAARRAALREVMRAHAEHETLVWVGQAAEGDGMQTVRRLIEELGVGQSRATLPLNERGAGDGG